MASPEGGVRGRIFPITPTRERADVSVVTKPDVAPSPTPEHPEKHWRERLVGVLKNRLVRLGLATGVIGLGGVGVYEAYQNIPAVHQAVDQQILQRFGLIEVPVPSSFDNTKDRGVIGTNNMVKLTQAKINQLFPTPFAKIELINSTIISLPQQLPPGAEKSMYPDILIKVGENKSTLQVLFPLDISKSSNPNTAISYERSFGGSSKAERDAYQGKEFYDMLEFQNVPGGTVIISPVDGYLLLSKDPLQPLPPNGSDSQGALIDFVAPNGNHYRLSINGEMKKDFQDNLPSQGTGFVFKSVVSAPPFEPSDNEKVLGTYGLLVRKGEPILQLITPQNGRPIDSVGMKLFISREGEVGKPIDGSKPSIPTNLELFLTPDNKIVIPNRQ